MNLKNKIYNHILPNYYAIIISLYIISLFVISIPRAAIVGVIMLIIDVVLINKTKIKVYPKELFVVIYICFCIFTVIRYFSNSLSINVFFASVSYSLLPMFFVLGRDKEVYIKTIDKSFKAIFISIMLAWILYIIAPSFYGKYLVHHSLSSREDFEWIRASIQGIYGITALSTFSAVSGLYYFFQFLLKRRKIYLVIYLISIITLLYTGRRSAIGAFIIAFSIEIFIFAIRGGKKTKRMGYAIIVICIVGGGILFQKIEEVILVLNRVIDIPTAIGERTGNWIEVLNDMQITDWIIGSGYGSRSHLVLTYDNIIGVYDNNYMELFAEIGIIGVILFICCIGIAFVPSFKVSDKSNIMNEKYKDYGTITSLIVIVYMIQAIGSNVWEFQILAPLFWMSIGYKIHI